MQEKHLSSTRYGAWIVIAGYTLCLAFTTSATTSGEEAYGFIKGTVTNALTGERLRKAYVRLAPASDDASVRPAVTNEEGRFAFENIRPGNYSLEAEHQGLMEGEPVELKLVTGQNLSNLNIKLMPPAAISGRVRDEDGDPWTHAGINVFRSVWDRGKRQLQGFTSAEVNDAGEFRVEHLPPGRYYLSADPDVSWEMMNRAASAPQLQPTWYPTSLDSSSAMPVVLLPGQEPTGVEIRLRRSSVYRIRGSVSGLHGVPVLPGPSPWMTPRLVASSTPGVGGNSKHGFLKPDGSFEIEGVSTGTWQIRVEQGLRPVMALGVATVQVSDHDVEGVSLTVQAPHPLKGVIRTEGEYKTLPAGLSVWLDSSDGLVWEETATPRSDGSFYFETVPSGRYRVHVGGGASSRYYLKLLRYGAIESSDSAFSISADRDTMELILSARGALVSGVVKRNSAGGSATPQVVLLPDTADTDLQVYDTHMGVLDQSGAFTVKGAVRPGEYTLYAFEGVPNGAWTDSEFMNEVVGRGVPIKVGEGDAKAVEVPLIPQSDVAGLLTRLGMN